MANHQGTIRTYRWWVVGGLALVYFVAYPEDMAVVVTPLERLLSLSQAVSTGLAAVLGGSLVAWPISRYFQARAAQISAQARAAEPRHD